VKRALLQRPLCALLRIFFRRVQVTGQSHVPAGPVIFILNHPNALIDPLILLCHTRRPVSFLAKEPLFRLPFIGQIVRAMDSIPVYRRMDQADTARNAATFAAARELLSRGGSLALFPEGTSHSDPRLKPFRTGVARIALGARVPGLVIVPAGLFYTAKSRFRSQALLCFGPPVEVPETESGPDGESPTEPVREFTAELERSLGELTLQADGHHALALAESAERILLSAGDGDRELGSRLQIRRRLLEGYSQLKLTAPERLEAISRRVGAWQARLDALGLTPELLPAGGYTAETVVRFTAPRLATLLGLFPLALLGTLIHLVPWVVVDLIGRRVRRSNLDLVSTVKILAGLVLYPLTWALLAWLTTRRWGLPAGLLILLLIPVSGFVALLFSEDLRRLLKGGRGLLFAITGKRRFLRLVAERQAIRDDLVKLAEELKLDRPATRPDPVVPLH
jgi:glycerol-3-phosphate O-acyltransferase/dihydroxyacetone phosphate acyltransferase